MTVKNDLNIYRIGFINLILSSTKYSLRQGGLLRISDRHLVCGYDKSQL